MDVCSEASGADHRGAVLMKTHKTAYRALVAWAGDSKRRLKQVDRWDMDVLLKQLIAKGSIEQFRAPGNEGFRFWYIVAKPGDWIVLDSGGSQFGHASSSKIAALKSIGESKAKRLRPGVYTAGGYTVGTRGAIEGGGV